MTIAPGLAVFGPLVCSPAAGSIAAALIDYPPAPRPIQYARPHWYRSFVGPQSETRASRRRILFVHLAAVIIAIWSSTGGSGAVECWLNCLLGWTLLTLAWIDVEQFRLPDALTLPLLGAGLVATEVTAPDALADHLIGAAVGYLAFRTVRSAYRTVRRKDGLGLGDAKLLSAAGAWLGWALLPDVVFGAALLGIGWAVGHALCFRRITSRVPFGLPLAIAIWTARLYGPALIGIDS